MASALWTEEKRHFHVETIKVVIVTKNTFWRNFVQQLLYFDFRQSQKEIRSSTKYKAFAQEERTTPSTLTGN
jgi:hypothetical protein